jgi:hypothetical protein
LSGGENKMKKTTIILGAVALVLGGLFSLTGTVSANGETRGKGSEYSRERHEVMVQIFENEDFDAWQEMMQDRDRFVEMVNEDTFSKLVEVHNLKTEGKIDEARQMREELGLKGGRGAKRDCQR